MSDDHFGLLVILGVFGLMVFGGWCIGRGEAMQRGKDVERHERDKKTMETWREEQKKQLDDNRKN